MATSFRLPSEARTAIDRTDCQSHLVREIAYGTATCSADFFDCGNQIRSVLDDDEDGREGCACPCSGRRIEVLDILPPRLLWEPRSQGRTLEFRLKVSQGS